jgi:hypothetical protein
MPRVPGDFLFSEGEAATGLMHQLKDIARRMGDCHVRTAKRWWKKLDAIQARLKRTRVQPDVMGHGAHKWHDHTADRLIQLWEDYYKSRGTTAETVRAKYAGDLSDARQIEFSLCKSTNSLNGSKNTPATTKLKSSKTAWRRKI